MNLSKKSFAKVNIFLKIVGKKDNYHLIASRFAKVHNLYDTINFIEKKCEKFTLNGNFSCNTKDNTIYKAYLQLCKISPKVQYFFKNHKVQVDKNIPQFAGLGGGSSNCATFITMVNDVCNLSLNESTLVNIALQIGADVPFFIYDYDCANVSGIGEIVEEFQEDIFNIDVFTPDIECDTNLVYKTFRQYHYKETSLVEIEKIFKMSSFDIYKTYNIKQANDLYESALHLNNQLTAKNLQLHENSFFSGSGSSFFTIDSR